MPVDEIVINNEIPVNDTDREYETAAEMPVDEIVINNEIPVNEPERENVPLEKNDMANTARKYETAAELFANAQLEIQENEPVDEELAKFFADLEQSALEENGLKEITYSEIKKPAITSVKILPPTKRITMNSKKITAVDDDEEHSKDYNTKKEDPVLPIRSGKHGKKIIAVDDDEDDVVILSQSSTSSSSSSSSGSSGLSGSSSSSSGPPPIMNEDNVAEEYDKKNKYRAEAGSSKPRVEKLKNDPNEKAVNNLITPITLNTYSDEDDDTSNSVFSSRSVSSCGSYCSEFIPILETVEEDSTQSNPDQLETTHHSTQNNRKRSSSTSIIELSKPNKDNNSKRARSVARNIRIDECYDI
ncbi:hypothetical protein HCN44_011002 [Aphidius gifuensis]|uniref:Uncharacterized protein n=1 Tax=Aphidius gifuensis TaxID=684658 RepID=A0A835CW00_APHGI|nr:hypothetical protein HCN44_011002 [Aphidius gifuensis]